MFKGGPNCRFVLTNLRNMQHKALITLESNPGHVLSTHQFIYKKESHVREIYFFVFSLKKIIKYLFRHNTSSHHSSKEPIQ